MRDLDLAVVGPPVRSDRSCPSSAPARSPATEVVLLRLGPVGPRAGGVCGIPARRCRPAHATVLLRARPGALLGGRLDVVGVRAEAVARRRRRRQVERTPHWSRPDCRARGEPDRRVQRVEANPSWIVEQFGFETMPWCEAAASAFTSGTTSGTSGSMRKALDLSTTTQPRATASGANARDVEPPAEKSARSKPSSASGVSSRTSSSDPANGTRVPADRADAKGTTSGGGEAALVQHLEHDGSDRAGGADDGHARTTQRCCSRRPRRARPRTPSGGPTRPRRPGRG